MAEEWIGPPPDGVRSARCRLIDEESFQAHSGTRSAASTFSRAERGSSMKKLDLRRKYKHLYQPSARKVEVVEVPETTKWEVAQRVLDQIVRLRQNRKSPVRT